MKSTDLPLAGLEEQLLAWFSFLSPMFYYYVGWLCSPVALSWQFFTRWVGAFAILMKLVGKMALLISIPTISCSLQVRIDFAFTSIIISFFSFKNINLWDHFWVKSLFSCFSFWATLFSKIMPNFWWTDIHRRIFSTFEYVFLAKNLAF